MKTKNENKTKVEKHIAEAIEKNIPLRGRKFEGYVIKKFDNRITIRFEKVKFIQKYERYIKTFSKIHARLPKDMKDEINLGDYVQIMECRPLSKIIHFIVIRKIRNADVKIKEVEENKK